MILIGGTFIGGLGLLLLAVSLLSAIMGYMILTFTIRSRGPDVDGNDAGGSVTQP